jgi:hypothetical protein
LVLIVCVIMEKTFGVPYICAPAERDFHGKSRERAFIGFMHEKVRGRGSEPGPLPHPLMVRFTG